MEDVRTRIPCLLLGNVRVAFQPPRARRAFRARGLPTYVTKRYALEHERWTLTPVKRCAGSILCRSAPPYPHRDRLSLPSPRWPQEEPLLLKRHPQVLRESQDYEHQKRRVNSTNFQGQVVEAHRLLRISPIRYAPKRKATGPSAAGAKTMGTGATTGAAAGAGHIFNIYKDICKDHTLLPYDAYPPWLLTLGEPEKSYGELAFTFLYGVGIENATMQEYMRFCRLHTKNLIKLNNFRLKKAKRSSIKPIYYDV